MELDYKQFLEIVKTRKNTIHQMALEDDILNNEFVRLSEVETSILKILRDKQPGTVSPKLTFNEALKGQE